MARKDYRQLPVQQGTIDNLTTDQLRELLERVARWPVFMARVETVKRRDKAFHHLARLSDPQEVHEAKTFLHECCVSWQELMGRSLGGGL
jgi:hypothetical protein